MFSITCFREHQQIKLHGLKLCFDANNFSLLSKSCYENNYMAIDQNKINSILATTVNYAKFSNKHITYSSIHIT